MTMSQPSRETPDGPDAAGLDDLHIPSPVVNASKVIRLAHTALSMFDDGPPSPWDEATRLRLARTCVNVVAELRTAVNGETMDELQDLLVPLRGPVPGESEVRVMRAQIAGWLNGLMIGEEMSTWAAGVADERDLAASLRDELSNPAKPERASPYR